jgi:hypothetical protein
MSQSTTHTRLTPGMGGVRDGRVVSLVVKPHRHRTQEGIKDGEMKSERRDSYRENG